MGVLTPLLRMPDLHVFAAPFHVKTGGQYLGDVVVATADGDQVVHVQIERDIAKLNKTVGLPTPFETLRVKMASAAAPLDAMPLPGTVFTHSPGIHIRFRRFRSLAGLQLEAVVVVGGFAEVVITSSAEERYGHSRDTREHMHLDVVFFNMREQGLFTGHLADVWGLQQRRSNGSRT
jgi:hypothetical protein